MTATGLCLGAAPAIRTSYTAHAVTKLNLHFYPHFRLVVRSPSPLLIDWNPPLAARHVAARQWTRSTVDSPSPAYQPLSWAQMARRRRLLSFFPRRMRNAEGPGHGSFFPASRGAEITTTNQSKTCSPPTSWLPDAWIPNPLGTKRTPAGCTVSIDHPLHRVSGEHRGHRLIMRPQ